MDLLGSLGSLLGTTPSMTQQILQTEGYYNPADVQKEWLKNALGGTLMGIGKSLSNPSDKKMSDVSRALQGVDTGAKLAATTKDSYLNKALKDRQFKDTYDWISTLSPEDRAWARANPELAAEYYGKMKVADVTGEGKNFAGTTPELLYKDNKPWGWAIHFRDGTVQYKSLQEGMMPSVPMDISQTATGLTATPKRGPAGGGGITTTPVPDSAAASKESMSAAGKTGEIIATGPEEKKSVQLLQNETNQNVANIDKLYNDPKLKDYVGQGLRSAFYAQVPGATYLSPDMARVKGMEDTVRSSLQLTGIEELKSKGGSLGQVVTYEEQMLGDAKVKIDNARNITDYKAALEVAKHAYEMYNKTVQDYYAGRFEQKPGEPSPSVNPTPDTGQPSIYKKWVPGQGLVAP